MSTPDSPTSKRRSFLLLIVVVIASVVAAFLINGGLTRPSEENASSTPSGGEVSAAPVVPVTTPTPTPVQSETTAPTPTPDPSNPDYQGTDEGYELGEPPPRVFTPDFERAPQDDDEALAAEAIAAVVPGWATLDASSPISAASWVATWSGEFAHTSIGDRSERAFVSLWQGVLAMQANAMNATIANQQMLWNLGSYSLWRVDITRDILTRDTDQLLMQETVTWDFLVRQEDDGFTVYAYIAPTDANAAPETFDLPTF